MKDGKSLGQFAYEFYLEKEQRVCGVDSVSWGQLADKIQEAWEFSAKNVYNSARTNELLKKQIKMIDEANKVISGTALHSEPARLTDEQVWLKMFCDALASAKPHPGSIAHEGLSSFRLQFPREEEK